MSNIDFEHIVAATDFSEHAAHSVSYAEARQRVALKLRVQPRPGVWVAQPE